MKKTRFTESRIVQALKDYDVGKKPDLIACTSGILFHLKFKTNTKNHIDSALVCMIS